MPKLRERVVATFPLNGQHEHAPYIVILEAPEEVWDGQGFRYYFDPRYRPRDFTHFDAFHEAIARALSNNGWGQYRIKDVTNA